MAHLHDLEVSDLLADCVSIDATRINEEFTRLPGDVAYLSELYSQANRAHLVAKAEFEFLEAQRAIYHREVAQDTGRKATEGSIREAVVTDPEYQAGRLRVVEAEAEKQACRGRLDAVMAKKDMLVSLGATLRAELFGTTGSSINNPPGRTGDF